VDPALFLSAQNRCGHRLCRGMPWANQAVCPMLSTPQLVNPSQFWPVFLLRSPREFRTDKPVTRCLDRPTEWSIWNPLGATGGTQTHSRRTGSKLGRLRCARQGLVRVPESNTKYGGKRGKTGGRLAFLCRQVSVSPQGFPSGKNLIRRANSGFARCSQGNYLLSRRGCPGETHVKLRGCPGWHARQPMASA
jgi:hypothetical protein